MEQKISDDISNTSPPTKKPKLRPKGNLSPSDATSKNAATIAESLDAANVVCNQQSTNIVTAEHQKQLKNGIFDFILPSEEDSIRCSAENLDLEEAHSAQVKERSLLGHLICSEETQKKILESDIFRILKSEGVTEIGALYKVSPSKFVLVFGSEVET